MEYNISARAQNTRLKEALQQAASRADEVVSGLSWATDAAVARSAVYDYVRIRYMLEPSDMTSESLNYLGEASLARSLGLSVEQVRKNELDSKCENTSSAMTKKILLVIALNKALEINIDEQRTADITTLGELADEVVKQLGCVEGVYL